MIITPGSAIWNFEEKTKTKQKNKNKTKNKKIFRLCLGIDHRRRKTIPLWNSLGEKRVPQGITVCLVSTILGTDDLVDFKLRADVRYLSFSIDTAPECIL